MTTDFSKNLFLPARERKSKLRLIQRQRHLQEEHPKRPSNSKDDHDALLFSSFHHLSVDAGRPLAGLVQLSATKYVAQTLRWLISNCWRMWLFDAVQFVGLSPLFFFFTVF